MNQNYSQGNKHHFLQSTSRRTIFSLVIGIVLVMVLIAALGLAKKTQAAPNLACSPSGYIIRDTGGGTEIQAIDMVTGQGNVVGHVAGRGLNAIGYNPIDNNFYAWDLTNGVFVKMNTSFEVTPFTPGNGMSGYAGSTNNIFSGDVDVDGHYWFFIGNTWHEANLNSGTPTIVGSGTPVSNPTGTGGTDWAFVPGTDKLYRAMDEGGNIEIWAFDRTSKLWSPEGTVSNIVSGSDGDMGSVYADPDGNFYMSSHISGKLFQIDLSDAPNFTAIELDDVDASSNDGARCALATVPVDYSDAPSVYGTLLDDDGPRHSIANFDIANSTAPLMLGTKIDIELDGFPGVTARGDDLNHVGMQGGPHVDDERGVTHIVATPGNSNPLVVPVRVTNTSGQVATLVGWIDLDNDNTFENSERVVANIPNGFNGHHKLTFPAPPAPYSTNTYARFRLFSQNDVSPAATGQLPTGAASTGEVEDVLVQVGSYDVTKSADPAEGSVVDPNTLVTYTLTVKNTGSTALTSLKIDDDLTDILDDATIEGVPMVSPELDGTATIQGNTLEFVGNVGVGGTVLVTYSVRIKEAATLGNAMLNNYVLGVHSTSCHPEVTDGNAAVDGPDCTTNHPVGGLADTGIDVMSLMIVSGGLLIGGATVAYFGLRRSKEHTS